MRALGLDTYQRSAQLQPALLTIAPLSATALLWAPKASATIGSLFSITAVVAFLSLLMQFGRQQGRKVQGRLIADLGALPSTLALRHRDQTIGSTATLRYHASLAKLGFPMPTPEEEAADNDAADDVYRSVTTWLPDQMRDPKAHALLHTENRSYGFRRNLLGLKPVALLIIVLTILVNGLLCYIYRLDTARLTLGLLLTAVTVVDLFLWIFIVRMSFVKDASWAYANRLLGGIERVKIDAPKSRKKKTEPS